MKKTNKLYRLVASLSKGEKRHFVLYASTFQYKESKSDYLMLFRLIEKHKIKDDKTLQKHLKSNQFKNISALKTYLYNKILESLFINSTAKLDVLYKGILNGRQLLHRSDLNLCFFRI